MTPSRLDAAELRRLSEAATKPHKTQVERWTSQDALDSYLRSHVPDILALIEERERMGKVVEAATIFRTKHKAIESSSEYAAIWFHAANHGMIWTGDNWKQEAEALDSALSALTKEHRDE